ncbi:class C sortase [uncultured Anaerococcus sp.]|uniref:class C sortase n=1 Tax=uncultured Anaerococcus sp. TaxID=293428 RepID=UPI002623937B|nr:class C sortase [uncultured Anaerococcus sp.]
MAFKKKKQAKKENINNSNPKKKVKKKKPQSKASKWLWRIIFIIGIAVMLYPAINRIYYRIDSGNQVDTFKSGTEELSTEEIKKRIELAHAFNESLSGEIADDPYSRKKQEEGRKEYARMLEVAEMIGHVEIPRIDQDLPIYAGTSEDILQKGVGHLEGTSLPVGGNSTHSVLTAHSGLPEATLFTNLKELEIGDKFYVHNIEGVMAYQVDQIKIVEPSNFSDLMVAPGHDYVTLLTCTPLMINTHRLLVRGHRVPYVPAVDEELIRTNKANWMFRILFFVALFLILVLIIRLIKLRKENKDYYARLEEVKKEQENLKNIFMDAGAGNYRSSSTNEDIFEQMRDTGNRDNPGDMDD